MRRQEGLTLTGFMVWAVVFVLVALFGFKVGPPYVEFYTIQKQLKLISDELDASATRRTVERAFDLRSTVEDIQSIRAADLELSKDGDRLIITANYSVRVPLVGNMSACLDFQASSSR
ncbi:MAG: hypothetical protein A3G24_04180 [Betaproteobacteria bacterium RIFCSPLOWO2_12_FULL_62_13]|nr:MAG: hypothetical protein A3G24_04180 [Betaproteobacteria bacterium RIFCSPLOWO2_12_FULL_62_13]